MCAKTRASAEWFEQGLAQCERQANTAAFEDLRSALRQRPLVLYGAGAVGLSLLHTLAHYGVTPECFCDREKHGQVLEGIPIRSPGQLTACPNHQILIASLMHYQNILADLQALGIPQENILPNYFLNLREGLAPDIQPHIEGYRRSASLFSDTVSRQVLMGRLECHFLQAPVAETCLLRTHAQPMTLQYFDPDLITLRKDEVFVDCGAFTGDTVQAFLTAGNRQYAHIYGFEPDVHAYRKAVATLSAVPRLVLENKGVSDTSGQISFDPRIGGSARADLAGSTRISVCSLDQYFSGTPHRPTFIKMDIEGAEKQALLGAEYTIRTHKPKLAICVYHKPQDIYELPELVLQMNPAYQLYLRHYSNATTETVLYAL